MTAVINEAIRTRSVFELEHRVLRVDGSLGWTFSRAIPLQNAGGKIVEWFGAASDITQRKLAELELAAAKQRLDAHMENSPLAVVEFDPQFCVIRWSHEAERLFGWSAAEVAGRSISEMRWR